MIYFQSLTKTELAQALLHLSRVRGRVSSADEAARKAAKQAAYRARQIFHWVYQRQVSEWEAMTDLSKELRAWLQENVEIFRLEERTIQQAADGTRKFLWQLPDGRTIESVIIPAALAAPQDAEDRGEDVRLTACLSSQVGCAMACRFCLTGIQGLDRNLETHEIVAQIHELRRIAPITNIVFMGMGEPLHNLDAVSRACQILLDSDGMNFSKRKVTVSTSGLVPAIGELGRRVDVSLAISLNATTDEQRSAIMPVNRKWNIESLLQACREYPLGSHRRITFEYVLIDGFNDSIEDAARLLRLLRGIPSKINLIPFNPHPGSDLRRPSEEGVRTFQRYLVDRKLTATVRISRGRDILAACGQLRSIFGTARGSERHRDYPA